MALHHITVRDKRFSTEWLTKDLDFEQYDEEPITVIGYLNDAIFQRLFELYGENVAWNETKGEITVDDLIQAESVQRDWEKIVAKAWSMIC